MRTSAGAGCARVQALDAQESRARTSVHFVRKVRALARTCAAVVLHAHVHARRAGAWQWHAVAYAGLPTGRRQTNECPAESACANPTASCSHNAQTECHE
eukprot:1094287-Pleurochrysis_carterae.AAC.1